MNFTLFPTTPALFFAGDKYPMMPTLTLAAPISIFIDGIKFELVLSSGSFERSRFAASTG